MNARAALLGLTAVAVLAVPGAARADSYVDDNYREHAARVGSAEAFYLELGLGLWQPDVGTNAFDSTFDGDQGPLVAGEIGYIPLRIPYVGRLGVGLRIGWASYTGQGFVADGDGQRTDEEAELALFPLTAVGVLRIDVLARELGIPLILTGKAGLDGIVWRSTVGERTEGRNVSWGFHWGAQAALELDFFNLRSARRLDDEWGINHTYLYFEAFGTTASTSLELTTPFAWTAGLGLIF